MRIACLLVPDLPLHAELRANPELKGCPLAITSGHGFRAEVLAASPEALARGIRIGQALPQVRALCPDLEIRVASPIFERAAREAMLDVALSLAPRAELAERASSLFLSEGAVYVDASGIEALHASESAFASVLHARAERAGIQGFVAIASSRSIARLVARHLAHRPTSASSETTQILSSKEETAFLSPLPIDLLDPDDRTAQSLTRFGIYCIRDLLRLSRRDLAARLGPSLLQLVARARGEETECPLAEPRIDSIEEGIDLESPIESLEPLSFVFRGLISRLVERLDLRSLGCVEMRTTLQLVNGAKQSRRIGIASPSQEERVLLRLLRLALEGNPPAAAVERVTLVCEGVPLRREQLDFFLPRGPSPSALGQTLAELGAICGNDRVGSPELLDDHRPDAFVLRPFSQKKPRSKSQNQTQERPKQNPGLMLRAIRPPVRAEVRVERGQPVSLRSAVSQGEILGSAGPWRTTGHWWEKSTHFAIDHYDVQMNDGNVLRLCFNWMTKRWQVDGLYD
jgi:protein ImuB